MIDKTGIGPKLLLLSLTVCFSSAYVGRTRNVGDKFAIGSKSNYPNPLVVYSGGASQFPVRNSISETNEKSTGVNLIPIINWDPVPRHILSINREKSMRRKDLRDLILYDLKHDQDQLRGSDYYRYRGKRSSKPKKIRLGYKKSSSSSSSTSESDSDDAESDSDENREVVAVKPKTRKKRDVGPPEIETDMAPGLAKKDKSSAKSPTSSVSSSPFSPAEHSSSSEEMIAVPKKDLDMMHEKLRRQNWRRGHPRRYGGRRKPRYRGRGRGGRKSSRRGKMSRRYKGKGSHSEESTSEESSSLDAPDEEDKVSKSMYAPNMDTDNGDGPMRKEKSMAKEPKTSKGPPRRKQFFDSRSDEDDINDRKLMSTDPDDFQTMMMMQGITDLTKDMKEFSTEFDTDVSKMGMGSHEKVVTKEDSDETDGENRRTIAVAISKRRKRRDAADDGAYDSPLPLESSEKHSTAVAQDKKGSEGTLAITVNGVAKHNGPYIQEGTEKKGSQEVTAFSSDWTENRNSITDAMELNKSKDGAAHTERDAGTSEAVSHSNGGGSKSSVSPKEWEAASIIGTGLQTDGMVDEIDELGHVNSNDGGHPTPNMYWPFDNNANVVGGPSTTTRAPARTKKFRKRHHHKKQKHHKGHRHGVTLVVVPVAIPAPAPAEQTNAFSRGDGGSIKSTRAAVPSSFTQSKAIHLSGLSEKDLDSDLNGGSYPLYQLDNVEYDDLERSYPARHIRVRRSPKSRSKYKSGGGDQEEVPEAAPTAPPPPPAPTKIEGKGSAGPVLTPANGSIATAKSNSGKAQATAVSKTGPAKATAINGTSANALALTAHETGEAIAQSDTYGEGGGKSIAVSRGKGNATGSATARGTTGSAQSTALAAQGGNARADSRSKNTGNATSNSASELTGSTTSNAKASNGSTAAFSISRGTGQAKANSLAGTGESRSLAQSNGGNAFSNSRTLENGSAIAVGATNGKGDTISNAVSKAGAAEAQAEAEKGDSVANAMNGSGEFLVNGEKGEGSDSGLDAAIMSLDQDRDQDQDQDIGSTSNAARRKRALRKK